MNNLHLMSLLALALSISACSSRSASEKLVRMAQEENKKYPLKIAKDITIDSTSFDKEKNTICYYYTVEGELDDSLKIAGHYTSIMQSLQDAAENTPEMEVYRKAGCAACYNYYSASSRKKLAEFRFSLSNPK